MGAETPSLSFIIPVRNDAARLRRCINSIVRTAFPVEQREIIVIDNGSFDDSAQVAADLGARVLSLSRSTIAELRNEAASNARGSILAFVDSDHEIGSDWCRAADEDLTNTEYAAAGALCHAPVSGTWVQRAYSIFRQQPRSAVEVTWLGSGNLAIRADVFAELGGFDTSLITCEDVDLCQRIRGRGYRILADPRLVSIHYGDPATLRRLFASELWRGRDNLRVSLRGPLRFRDVPSVAVPVIDVICAAAVVALLAVRGNFVALAGAAAIPPALSAARTARALKEAQRWCPIAALQAFVVRIVYDAARAMALVVRAGHHRTAQ